VVAESPYTRVQIVSGILFLVHADREQEFRGNCPYSQGRTVRLYGREASEGERRQAWLDCYAWHVAVNKRTGMSSAKARHVARVAANKQVYGRPKDLWPSGLVGVPVYPETVPYATSAVGADLGTALAERESERERAVRALTTLDGVVGYYLYPTVRASSNSGLHISRRPLR
jgi:hypothetical protein